MIVIGESDASLTKVPAGFVKSAGKREDGVERVESAVAGPGINRKWAAQHLHAFNYRVRIAEKSFFGFV